MQNSVNENDESPTVRAFCASETPLRHSMASSISPPAINQRTLATSTTKRKTTMGGKLFLALILLILLSTIGLLTSYFVLVPAYLTSKFHRQDFNFQLLRLNQVSFLHSNDTHLQLKTLVEFPRVYYGSEVVEVHKFSGFSGLFIITIQPTSIDIIPSQSNAEKIVANLDINVKFKSPEYFQLVALAFSGLRSGLPAPLGTIYCQFVTSFKAGHVLKYNDYPAFKIVNMTGQSLNKFIVENSVKEKSVEEPLFQISTFRVNTIERGVAIDLFFKHLINLPTEVKQSKPYHLYINDKPFLEIGFSPMNFSNEKVHTRIQLKLLDLEAAGNSLVYAASLANQVAIPPMRLVHGSSHDVETLKEASKAKEQNLFGSLILFPLPKRVQEFLSKSASKVTTKKEVEEPMERTWNLAFDSIAIDKRNNLVIQLQADVTPSFLKFKTLARIEELEMDTGFKVTLMNETSSFLNVSVSHIKAQGSNNITTFNFQVTMAFTKGKLAIKSREDMIRVAKGLPTSLTPYFTLSALSSSNLKNSECSWCQSIQTYPFPFPLEDFVGKKKESNNEVSGINKGLLHKYKKRLLRKLKEADREVSFEVNKEDGIKINLKLKTEELPTDFKLGSISTDISYNSDLFSHIDISSISKQSYLDVTLRLQHLEMNLIESAFAKLLAAYLLDTKIPTSNKFTLSNLRIGSSPEDTVLVLRNLLGGSFEFKKIYSWIEPLLPNKAKWTKKIEFLDFSQYSSTELPISLVIEEDYLIAFKFQFFLKKKSFIQKIKKVFFSAKLTLDNKDVAELEITDLTYDRETSKLVFVLRFYLLSNLQTLKSWALAWGVALKGDMTLKPSLRKIKFGNTKETAKPLLEEITPEWILTHILPLVSDQQSRFSSFISEKLIEHKSVNENIELKEEGQKVVFKREAEPSLGGTSDSAFKAITSSTKYWMGSFMEELGLSKADQTYDTACFSGDDKPVMLKFPSESRISITLKKCQSFALPFRMRLTEIKIKPLVNLEELGTIVVKDGYISASSDQLIFEIDIEYDFSKEKVKKNIITLLDSFSSHIEQGQNLSDFLPLSFDIELEGGIKIEPKPIPLFRQPSTEDINTSSKVTVPELELGPVELKLDSKGLQLALEISYPTLTYEFSYSIEAFGFFIYQEKKPILQFELDIPRISNNAISLKLRLMPMKENVALLPEVLQQLLSTKIELNTLSISHWYFNTPKLEEKDTRPHYPFKPNRVGLNSSALFTNWKSIKSEYREEGRQQLILGGVKLLFYKHPSHSIRVPYFRLNLTRIDGSWLQVASLDNGINVVSGQQFVVIMVTTDSMAFLPLLFDVAKFESITDLTFGDSKEFTLPWIEKTPLFFKKAFPSLNANQPESLPIDSAKLKDNSDANQRYVDSEDKLVKRSNIENYIVKRDLTSQQDDELDFNNDDFKFNDENEKDDEVKNLFKASPQEAILGPKAELKPALLSNNGINGNEQNNLVESKEVKKEEIALEKKTAKNAPKDKEEDAFNDFDFSFNDEKEGKEVPEVSWSELKVETEKVWPPLPQEVSENPLKIHISGKLL